MRTSTNQYGDFPITGASHQIDHARGFVIFVEESVYLDSGVFPAGSSDASRVSDGPRPYSFFLRTNPGEGLIHPFDQRGARSKVDIERQRFETDRADAILPGLEKQADI